MTQPETVHFLSRNAVACGAHLGPLAAARGKVLAVTNTPAAVTCAACARTVGWRCEMRYMPPSHAAAWVRTGGQAELTKCRLNVTGGETLWFLGAGRKRLHSIRGAATLEQARAAALAWINDSAGGRGLWTLLEGRP